MDIKNRYHLTFCEEYGMWLTLMKGCYDPKNINYKKLGGRGFCLCKEWLNFDDFQHAAYFNGDQNAKHYVLSLGINTSPYKDGRLKKLSQRNCYLYRTSFAEIEVRLKNRAIEKANKEWLKMEKEQRHAFNEHHPRFYSYTQALPYEFDKDWLFSFADPEKLKFLLRYCKISNETVVVDCKDYYIDFVNHFYYDAEFNAVYDKWQESNRFGAIAPSLDHILPQSKGGTDDLSNLRFITNIENWCKGAQSLEVWEANKAKYKDNFFI